MAYELFELVENISKENYILKMPMDQLQLVLQNNSEEADYEIKVGSINNIIFTKKGDKNLINIKCIKSYYNIDINGNNIDSMTCQELKTAYTNNRDVGNCVKQYCAKCHLCAIEDFYDDKITRKK